jgi:hypothetical protein
MLPKVEVRRDTPQRLGRPAPGLRRDLAGRYGPGRGRRAPREGVRATKYKGGKIVDSGRGVKAAVGHPLHLSRAR